MQIIYHPTKHIHPIFNQIDSFYTMTSTRCPDSGLIPKTYDYSFERLYDIFKDNGWKGDVNLAEKPTRPFSLKEFDEKNIIVCLSGGKDSIVVVKHYLDLGYNVYLYHMRHINFALSDEYQAVQKLAEHWNLPLYIEEVKLSGHHDYIEHPMKNMIIANGALEYGIRNNIGTNIAFGNYKTSTLSGDNFEFCGGDDIEMWEAYEDIIHTIIPNFHIHLVLDNLNETLETLCADKELLNMSISCLGRANLRQHKHDWVKNKYGIELPQHRCGQCYKCCVEYIYMTDNNLQEYSEEYYKYCLNKLKQNVEAEDGTEYSEEYVWNHYFFYPIERSRYYGKCR